MREEIRARMNQGAEMSASIRDSLRRIVSGDVPSDPAETVDYVVVKSGDKRVVATFKLPGRSSIPKFAITVAVPSASESYEAGRLDERGRFKAEDFRITETSPFHVGAGAEEARRG